MKEDITRLIDSIEVPEEAKDALIKGIRKGDKEAKGKKRGRKRKVLFAGLATLAAAIVIGMLPGSYLTAVKDMFLKEPSGIEDTIGGQLKEKGKVTPQNIVAEDNGIKVTITGSYFDGGQMGVLYTLEGIEEENPLPEVMVHIDSDNENWHSALGSGRGTPKLFPKGNGIYEGEIAGAYPGPIGGEEYTLPLIFTSINSVEGNWQLEVPMGKMEAEFKDINSFRQEGDMEVGISRIFKGELISTVEYYVMSKEQWIGVKGLYSKNAYNGEYIGSDFIMSGLEVGRETVEGKEKVTYRAMFMNQGSADKMLGDLNIIREPTRESFPLS